MNLPLKELSKILNSYENILLTGPANPNIDVISTALAWNIFLSLKNKKVDLFFSGKVINLPFLDTKKIKKDIDIINNFKIILDITNKEVDKLDYNIDGNELYIDIISKKGALKEENIKLKEEDYKYDLIISFGASNLKQLGNVFEEHDKFFHNTPVINLDNSLINENFGQLNIVKGSSTSLSEISYYILEKNLNKEISTALLSGMISATNSFQSSQVTPSTLELASNLITKGAEREKIIENLYRTKNINTLKSWGKVLSRLKQKKYIISSFLRHQEIEKIPQDFEEMIKELILSTNSAQVAIIFYQLELNKTEAWIYTIDNIDALDLTRELQGSGRYNFSRVIIDKNIENSKKSILKHIEDKISIINN